MKETSKDFNPEQEMIIKEWKKRLAQHLLKTAVEGNLVRPPASLQHQVKRKHSEALPGQRSCWSEEPGERSLSRSEVQALETEQQVFCGPQLVSQEKWRPWAGLTMGIRTFIQVATIQEDRKKKR